MITIIIIVSVKISRLVLIVVGKWQMHKSMEKRQWSFTLIAQTAVTHTDLSARPCISMENNRTPSAYTLGFV